jgi:glycosyltransferase involved in cell wall biosynthesis
MPSKVSIITPVYNRVTWLPQALESALNQTHPDIEVILIDDGSDTEEAKRIAEAYADVRYLWQPNQGSGPAKNKGLTLATGEFILFLDDDDWLTPEAVAEKLPFLEEDPSIGIVYSDLYLVTRDNSIICRYYEHRKTLPPSGDLYLNLLPSNFIPIDSILWRRSVIEEAGGFPNWSGLEDWFLLLRAAERTRIQYVNKVHGGYRIHDTNLTRILGQQIRGYTKVQEEVIGSERFTSLPHRDQSKVLTHYAVLQMMSGDPVLGRTYLNQARELKPSYLPAQFLGLLALVGRAPFQILIKIFRRIRFWLQPIPSSTSIFLGYD